MHEEPKVVSYNGEELTDLLGPVETQYNCDVIIEPPTLVTGAEAMLVVDFSDMRTFKTIRYEVSGGGGGISDSIRREDGNEDGTEWYVTGIVPTEVPPGSYRFTVRLVDGDNVGQPCSTTFDIYGGTNGVDSVP